ncbi:MAG: hypothetical protein ABSB19_07930 [Methylomonas sp.]
MANKIRYFSSLLVIPVFGALAPLINEAFKRSRADCKVFSIKQRQAVQSPLLKPVAVSD